ncbi:MAG TPA: hypothetical protein VG870_13325 [Chitinophagaceae bacterium]|nr:hypothetical protein [Chitinophagaceae bacterium]
MKKPGFTAFLFLCCLASFTPARSGTAGTWCRARAACCPARPVTAPSLTRAAAPVESAEAAESGLTPLNLFLFDI